jgi:P27 family predicted phage terminase small subunit
MSLPPPKINKDLAHSRLRQAKLAHWLEDPTTWDKEKFAEEVGQAMLDAYGLDVEFDSHMITLLTDQMDTYVKATAALNTEPLVDMATNGTRMPNPNQKIRDNALARCMQLLTMLGLVPSGRPKKSNAPNEIDELLAGPQY